MNRRYVAVCIGIGVAAGVSNTALATRAHGYVAPYYLVSAVVVGGTLLVLALLFCAAKPTRRFAVPIAVAALSGVLACWASMAAATRLGFWKDPMVAFGPEVPADLVV